MSAYTIVIHGNDATGKSSLAPALRAAGATVCARGDGDGGLEDALAIRAFDKLTLCLPDAERAPLPDAYTDVDGVHRRVVRVVLNAELNVLRARLAKRPSTDKWESEKALFYFRARFLELAAFYGLPIIDTGKNTLDETVSEILALAENPDLLGVYAKLALRTLTPDDVEALAKACTPLSLRLVAEETSQHVYKIDTTLTRAFDSHVLVVPQVRPLQAANQTRLFLETLHRAGVDHAYECINAHGLVWARVVDVGPSPLEVVYEDPPTDLVSGLRLRLKHRDIHSAPSDASPEAIDTGACAFLAFTHYLRPLGLKLAEARAALDSTGRTLCSAYLRIEDADTDGVLRAHLAARPFHEHEMVSPHEPYSLCARALLEHDLEPATRAVCERLAAPVDDRSRVRPADSGPSSS